VRLIDIVFRQGHLSERALIGSVTSGARPAHLDRCDLCAERAVLLARWLDEVQTDATDLADGVFTPERLAAQQHQILRRLEQLDQPVRVISFPAASRAERPALSGRRVAVSWVGVAAAAGLVIGVVGGQVSARLATHAVPPPPVTAAAEAVVPGTDLPAGPVNTAVFTDPLEDLEVGTLDALNRMTPRFPRLTQISARTGR